MTSSPFKPLNSDEIETIFAAVNEAVREIHNPGYGRASGVDVLGILEDARKIIVNEMKMRP